MAGTKAQPPTTGHLIHIPHAHATEVHLAPLWPSYHVVDALLSLLHAAHILLQSHHVVFCLAAVEPQHLSQTVTVLSVLNDTNLTNTKSHRQTQAPQIFNSTSAKAAHSIYYWVTVCYLLKSAQQVRPGYIKLLHSQRSVQNHALPVMGAVAFYTGRRDA